MFSPENLLQIATESEAVYQSISKEFPAGTVNIVRNAARRKMEDALACAAWMEKNNMSECANVGPFMTTKIVRGQRVRIRKGAVVFGTSSKIPREGIELSRAQVVTVHAVDNGYIDYRDSSKTPPVVQGRVNWAGTGGYWRWTDINNVEIILTLIYNG